MKKQDMNVEAQTVETTEIEKKAPKAVTKKEEKKMAEKKNETGKVIIPEFLKAYRQNETGEFLMTGEMFDEFKNENPTLVFGTRKTDKDLRLVKMNKTDKQPTASIRIDETAKKKQVHVHTGETKKVVSGRDEKTGIRYKVIFRKKNEKYELWTSDPAGKRKMMIRGTEKEVMAEYQKFIKTPTGKAEKKEKKTA